MLDSVYSLLAVMLQRRSIAARAMQNFKELGRCNNHNHRGDNLVIVVLFLSKFSVLTRLSQLHTCAGAEAGVGEADNVKYQGVKFIAPIKKLIFDQITCTHDTHDFTEPPYTTKREQKGSHYRIPSRGTPFNDVKMSCY